MCVYSFCLEFSEVPRSVVDIRWSINTTSPILSVPLYLYSLSGIPIVLMLHLLQLSLTLEYSTPLLLFFLAFQLICLSWYAPSTNKSIKGILNFCYIVFAFQLFFLIFSLEFLSSYIICFCMLYIFSMRALKIVIIITLCFLWFQDMYHIWAWFQSRFFSSDSAFSCLLLCLIVFFWSWSWHIE